MTFKEIFLNCLSDEQLGFFYAHENNGQLADMLQGELTVTQYKLFEEWKEQEAKLPTHTGFDPVVVENLVFKLDNWANKICSRMDELEAKLISAATFQARIDEKLEVLNEKVEDMPHVMAKLDEIHKETAEKISAIEQRIEEAEEKSVTANDEFGRETILACPSSLIPTTNNVIAEKWCDLLLEIIESCTSDEEKETLGNKETFEMVLKVMKDFEVSEEIESKCCKILNELNCSDTAGSHIVKTGCPAHLSAIFKKNWPDRETKDEMLEEIYWVLNVLFNGDGCKHVEKDFVDILLLCMSSEVFTQFDILSVDVLSDLLDLDDNDLPSKLAKSEIGKRIKENMNKWVLGRFNPLVIDSYSDYLDNLTSGKISKRIYSAWLIANQTICAAEDCDLLREEGAITILQEIRDDVETNSEVKKYIRIALENLKK